MFEPLVCCLNSIWVHPYSIPPAKLAPDFGSLWVTWGFKMMPICHVWCWYPPQTSVYIHIRHIQGVWVWAIGMLSQGHTMGAPVYHSTGQVDSDVGILRVAYGVEMMPSHYGWGCHHIQTASPIHIIHIQSVWAHWYWYAFQGRHRVAALHHYTRQVQTQIWESGSLRGAKWWHYVMVEATILF